MTNALELQRKERLEGLLAISSQRNRSATAVPLSTLNHIIPDLSDTFIGGSYDDDSTADQQKVTNAARSSYGISVGKPELFTPQPVTVSKGTERFSPTERAGILSKMQFGPALDNLPSHNSIDGKLLSARPADVASLIAAQLREAQERIGDSQLVAPYFLQRTNPDSQIDITDRIRNSIQDLAQQVNDTIQHGTNEGSLQFNEPHVAFIVDSLNRGRLIPDSIPVNTSMGDFDSSKCDQMMETSFTAGDKVVVLAENNGFVFVAIDTKGYMAWVPKESVGTLAAGGNEQQLAESEQFYAGSTPLFYPDATKRNPNVLLPGDSIYMREGKPHTMKRNQNGEISWQPVPTIPTEQISQGMSTPPRTYGMVL